MRGNGVTQLAVLILFAHCGSVSAAHPRESVSEGLLGGGIQVTADRDRRTFDASADGSSIRLESVGPAIEINGKRLTTADSVSSRAVRQQFEDVIGRGEELVIDYRFAGDLPRLRYEIKRYDGHAWLGVSARLSGGGYRLGDVELISGKIRISNAFEARVYFNTGVAGGGTGVWPLGMRRWNSDTLSSWYSPSRHDSLTLGFYSFQRAATSVTSQYQSYSEIRVSAAAHYNDYQPEQELQTESLLINFAQDPLQALEQWVDASVQVVHPHFNADTRTSVDNTWYAIGDKASADFGLSQAQLLRKTPLFDYGVDFFELGEWQRQRNAPGDYGDALGFGESEVDDTLYPKGVAHLCKAYHDLGFGCSFGANYAYAAHSTSTAAAKPPWLNTNDLSKPFYGYPIDFTHPDAQKWLFDLYHTGAQIDAGWIWSDFDGGPRQGALYDKTKIRGFEDIRAGIQTIRKAVGPTALIHRFCCGPYFTYVGLVDRVRTGDDVRGIGDWLGLQEVVRALASTYMLHGKFWINDPDPLLIGAREYVHNYGAGPIPPDPAIVNEVRMRMMLQVASGSFLTIGENLEDFTPESLQKLTQVLPSYGQAARPLDLFVHTTPEVFDLRVQVPWDTWHVLMLENWNEADKEYPIRFREMGLDENKSYLVFSFWDQRFVGEYRGNVGLRAARHTGETYAIREVPDHPWVLGTNMHLTQGAVELQSVRYDGSSGRLSGTASRHAGAKGQLVIYAPPGFQLRDGSEGASAQRQASGASVITVPLSFAAKAKDWTVRFDRVAP
ncbi:MAG TPA: hypothetical protein VNO35_15175 [Steroidobacteraceae bacterium]|nr:hypothetical protein [Steroidobacteraceae bacterium]